MFRRRCSVHLDQRSALRLQGLREPFGPGAEERERMVLVGHPRQDTGHQPDSGRLDLQAVEQERSQEGTATGQRRVRHQRHGGVVPERAEQRVRRRYRVARHRLLSREAVRVRGQRRASQLRGRHQPGTPTLRSPPKHRQQKSPPPYHPVIPIPIFHPHTYTHDMTDVPRDL